MDIKVGNQCISLDNIKLDIKDARDFGGIHITTDLVAGLIEKIEELDTNLKIAEYNLEAALNDGLDRLV